MDRADPNVDAKLEGNGADSAVSNSVVRVERGDSGADGRGTRVEGKASLTKALTDETQSARALIESIRDLVGDDAEMIDTAVEGETDLHEAIGAAAKRYVELDALIAAATGLIETIKDRSDRFKRQQVGLKEAIAVAMEGAEIKKLELPIATLSLRRVPPALDLKDEWLVPERFWKAQDPKLDRRAVLDAIKAGEVVPGASLDNGGISLQVRQK